MGRTFGFLFRQILLGTGLAMDAFSISIADGLREPDMSRRRMCLTAGIYGGFQAFMPLTGRTLFLMAAEYFAPFRRTIPWLGGCILLCLGGGMFRDAWGKSGGRDTRHKSPGAETAHKSPGGDTCQKPHGAEMRQYPCDVWDSVSGARERDITTLLLQGAATSIDALSAGCVLTAYPWGQAVTAAGIIAGVTFGWCLTGLWAGRRFGGYLSDRATAVGGMILCGIGAELLLRGGV